MLKVKSFITAFLILSFISTSANAGVTTSLLMAPLAPVQAVTQKISATISNFIALYQKGVNTNYGLPGVIKKEVITSDNSPLLTAEDVAFYTDDTFAQTFLTELKKDKHNISKMHQVVKGTYLVDYGAKDSLNDKDEIDLEEDKIITIDPLGDAKRVNTQEFIQYKRHLTLHHGLAIAEKILALMKKQDAEVESMTKNIKSRREIQSLEKGLSILDKKIAVLLNELLVVEASLLEVNTTLLMQDKQIQIVQEKKGSEK